MTTKIAQAEVIAQLRLFWHRSRKCFVPRTSGECRRAEVPVDTLLRAGMIERYSANGENCYRLTEAGRGAFGPGGAP